MTNDREYRRTHPWISFRHHLERADPIHWALLGEAAARCDQVARAILPPADAREMHQLYLVKGARATTAIEGNTLSEEQIGALLEGRLELPPSREYLKREVENVLHAVNGIFAQIMNEQPPELTPDWIAGANRRLLAGLGEHLEEGVVPGEIPVHPVVVMRYRGAPREDCAFLLHRLCGWLEGDDWPVRPDRREDRTASAILRAVFVHLYIAWIHPFGDGNGRTARLAEYMILAREGVPSPCAHLLSNHYNLTRSEYYRQLDRSSRANSGRGDPLDFLLYSLQGFVDGLREQSRFIERVQLKLAWKHFVYGEFRRIPPSPAMRRRREVTLALGRVSGAVRQQAIPDLSPDLARRYADRTGKTLTRDMNWLVKRDFVERGEDGYRAKVDSMRAFRPARA
ncbi:MAG: Fic family protein [Gemmatimonadota bacterium]|nr:Fic family protein [Gemmatimonadota bacterium]